MTTLPPLAWRCDCPARHNVRSNRTQACPKCQITFHTTRGADVFAVADQRPDLIFSALQKPKLRRALHAQLTPDPALPPAVRIALAAYHTIPVDAPASQAHPPQFNAPKLVKGKLYLRLFHGRLTPTETLDDWGFDGPIFGPLVSAHTTFASDLKLVFETDVDVAGQGLDPDLPQLAIARATVYFAGCWFGDWVVFRHAKQ